MPSGCKKQSSKKYTRRDSPSYPANECCGLTKKGNDGKKYVSQEAKNGVCKWVLVKKKTSGKKSGKKTAKSSGKKTSGKKSGKKSSGNEKTSKSSTKKSGIKTKPSQIAQGHALDLFYFLNHLTNDVGLSSHHLITKSGVATFDTLLCKLIKRIAQSAKQHDDIYDAISHVIGSTLFKYVKPVSKKISTKHLKKYLQPYLTQHGLTSSKQEKAIVQTVTYLVVDIIDLLYQEDEINKKTIMEVIQRDTQLQKCLK